MVTFPGKSFLLSALCDPSFEQDSNIVPTVGVNIFTLNIDSRTSATIRYGTILRFDLIDHTLFYVTGCLYKFFTNSKICKLYIVFAESWVVLYVQSGLLTLHLRQNSSLSLTRVTLLPSPWLVINVDAFYRVATAVHNINWLFA